MRIEQRIGKRLREAREQAHLTQEQLGEELARWFGPNRRRWSKQTVSAAEAGRRAFTAEDLLVLSYALRKPIYWFFGVGDYVASTDERGRVTTNVEELMAEMNEVRLPNGTILSEEAIERVVGTPPSEVPRLAEELRVLADRIESIRDGGASAPEEEGEG